MSPSAISISGLNKIYRVWPHPRDMLVEGITGRKRHAEFEALRDVDMDVPRGSVMGILGRNGAGKSTLLRIVAGTLDATSGNVAVNGRVAAILELGTGFHPEYTGRENVLLGGLCLGLDRDQINARFDEIVSFAELGEVIDRPFRTYSTGMQARLTFAVATSIDADILIIDEALAVGDARFQLKSFDRVRQFKAQGRSILLVSHDINQIISVCDTAVLLDAGRVVASGDPARVGNIYHEMLFGPKVRDDASNGSAAEPVPNRRATIAVATETETQAGCDAPEIVAPVVDQATSVATVVEVAAETEAVIGVPAAIADPEPLPAEHRYGEGSAQIVDVHVCNAEGKAVSSVRSLERYRLVCRIRAEHPLASLCFGMLIRDRRGLDLFGWDMLTGGHRPLASFRAGEERDVSLWFTANLAAGDYFVTAALARWDDGFKYDVRFDALHLRVDPTPTLFTASVINLDVDLEAQCEGDRRDPESERVA